MPPFFATLVSIGPAIVFWVLAITTVAAAIAVVAAKNPVHSALFLLLTFATVAGLFIMQGAEFVGAVQLLVYAGGIMVLFLFVIMLVNVRQMENQKAFHAQTGIAIFLGALLLVTAGWGIIYAAQSSLGKPASAENLQKVPEALMSLTKPGATTGNSQALGIVLYGRYLIPFEVASILLLVAMIGAIVMGKKRLESDEVDH